AALSRRRLPVGNEATIGPSMVQSSRCSGPDRGEEYTVVIVALASSRVAVRTRPRVRRTVIGAILKRSISPCQPLSRFRRPSSAGGPPAAARVTVHFVVRPALQPGCPAGDVGPMTGADGRHGATEGARTAPAALSLGTARPGPGERSPVVRS